MRGYGKLSSYSVATVMLAGMLVVASCSSQPAETAQDTKPTPSAAPTGTSTPAGTLNSAAAAPSPAPDQTAANSGAPARKTAVPAHNASDTTMPQPMNAPDQTAANMLPPPPPEPAPIPVPTPVQQAAAPLPIPAPLPPPEPTTKQVTIPSGTQVYIRMIDSISSDTAQTGETFRASLDKPIVVDNLTVAPKNADVYVKLASASSAGKLSGQSQLQVQLDRIFIGKKSYNIVSNTYQQAGASEGAKAARNVGVGAVVGGVLGGILGGGKGAVIGAGAGGGGGAAVSKGQQIRIESEAQLVFRLENPLDVTLNVPPPSTASTSRSSSDGPVLLTPPSADTSSRNSSNSSSNNGNNSNTGAVSGTWTVTTDATQGASMQLVLRQNGTYLQGSITNPAAGGAIQIQGNVDGNFITFSTPQNSAFPMQYSGAISGDTMQGTVILPVSNNGSVLGGGNGGIGGIGFPGSGYPGSSGGGRRGGGTRQTTQAHWNAQRIS